GIRDRNVTGVQTCGLPIFSKKFASQAPKDSTKFSNRNNVGPSSSAETVSTPASERLMEDIHFIPLPTPETTDAVEINVMAIINTTSKILSAWSTTPKCANPVATCWTPRPTDVATPAIVPKTANTSMVSPTQPHTRLAPGRGPIPRRIAAGGPPRRTLDATPNPLAAYTAGGCSPQCGKLWAIPSLASCSGSPRTPGFRSTVA